MILRILIVVALFAAVYGLALWFAIGYFQGKSTPTAVIILVPNCYGGQDQWRGLGHTVWQAEQERTKPCPKATP